MVELLNYGGKYLGPRWRKYHQTGPNRILVSERTGVLYPTTTPDKTSSFETHSDAECVADMFKLRDLIVDELVLLLEYKGKIDEFLKQEDEL